MQCATAQPAPAAGDCPHPFTCIYSRMTQAAPAEVSWAGRCPQSQEQLDTLAPLLEHCCLGAQLCCRRHHTVQPNQTSLVALPLCTGPWGLRLWFPCLSQLGWQRQKVSSVLSAQVVKYKVKTWTKVPSTSKISSLCWVQHIPMRTWADPQWHIL